MYMVTQKNTHISRISASEALKTGIKYAKIRKQSTQYVKVPLSYQIVIIIVGVDHIGLF